jgi:hypothetical protein
MLLRGQESTAMNGLGLSIIEWSLPQQLPSQSRQRDLMHHYFVSTSLTSSLLEDKDMQQIWQQKVPLETQAHAFLLHGIIGFAALHLSHLHGPNDRDYQLIACQQHAKAIKAFQVSVINVNSENCAAVLAFSLIMAMRQFDMSFTSGLLQAGEQFERILDALSALRGAWYLVMHYRPLMEQGPLGILLTRPRNLVKGVIDPETSNVLGSLESINQSTADTEETKAIYSDVIQKLYHWYSLVSPNPRTWAHIIKWPSELPPEYFTFLQQKRPMALTILAHWCVPLHRAPYRWFVEGWAKQAVQVMAHLVDGAYVPAMIWPLQQVGLNTELLQRKISPTEKNVQI